MRYDKFLISSSVIMTMIIAACGSQAPMLQAPPEKHSAVNYDVKSQQVKDPNVQILFVIDNSSSMDAHQQNLAKNLDAFADKFFQNVRINYKIGVVPMFDSRYQNGAKECASQSTELVTDAYGLRAPRNVRKMNPLGQLVPLKDPKDGNIIANVPPYITPNTPNGKEILKRTLHLGTQCGPEAGEFFSPVLAVMGKSEANDKYSPSPLMSYAALAQGLDEKNQHFYGGPDDVLVLIFLTDADNVNNDLNYNEFYNVLLKAKKGNGDKILVLAATPDSKNVNNSTCTIDGSTMPEQFNGLIQKAKGKPLNLCSGDFGKQLAEAGDLVAQRVAPQSITVPFVPNIDKNYDNACTSAPSADVDSTSGIVITYGTSSEKPSERQRICAGPSGYTIDPVSSTETNIVLSPNLNITREDGAHVYISPTPVNLHKAKKIN